MKVIDEIKSFTPKYKKLIKLLILLQSKARSLYFVTPYDMSSNWLILIGKFFLKFPKISFFMKNQEIKKSGIEPRRGMWTVKV